jgi:lysophospholipase L1-like esterase
MTAPRSGPAHALAGLVGLATALLLTACDSGGGRPFEEPTGPVAPATPGPTATSTAPGPAAPSGLVYAALGDSFVAAPLVPRTNLRHGCLRSDHNYPHLVAAELPGYALVDVSCSGASSAEITVPQVVGGVEHPPQLDALSDEVDIVTLGIGANDFSLFSLLVYRCLQLAGTDRAGAPCRESYDEEVGGNRLLDQVAEIQDRVEAVVAVIRDRAPQARVVLVTYPKFLPDFGVCPDLVPLAKGDYVFVREVNLALVEAQAAGATAAGAEVLDVYAASDGHDICADRPWVNGIDTDPSRALAFHPFPEEQRAVADLLLDLVGQG